MINIDLFYLLLLLEVLLIQSVIIVIIYLKRRKLKIAHMRTVKILRDFKWQGKDAQGNGAPELDQKEASRSTKGETVKTDIEGGQRKEGPGPQVENIEKALEEKIEIILEMKKKIQQMEKKYVDMEREYQILFDQTQKQEAALRQYEEGK